MSNSESAALARAVSEARLWQRHVDMARIGATPKGGVNRLALTAEENEARRLLCRWAEQRGYAVFADAIGNIFVRRPGTDPDAAPVMSGSHMDTQPTGGRFDGMFGVLAAFEALEALDDAAISTRRPIEAVAWTNEEGSRWFTIEVEGEEAHAGTTPLAARKDAFRAATAMVQALQELMADPSDTVRFTIGRFEVMPGSPNTVPGRVLFTIDFRHPDDATIARLGDQVEPICRALAGPCSVRVTETSRHASTWFDRSVVDVVAQATDELGYPGMELFSGAGHDARCMAPLCPTAMIFVPCAGGVSHNEAEDASPSDLAAGARVLATVLRRLADS